MADVEMIRKQMREGDWLEAERELGRKPGRSQSEQGMSGGA